MDIKSYINKYKISHSLVYRKDKEFKIDRITIFIALFFAIILYSLIVDPDFQTAYALGSLSIFTILILLFIDFIIYPFLIKYIIGHGIDGTWIGKFIAEQPEKKEIKISSFEIYDFGKKCLIIVTTEYFTSHSIVAKLVTGQENDIDLKFIYKVVYKDKTRDNHFGMTELTIYKDGKNMPEGKYYTRDNGILRYGRIILEKRTD